MRNFTNLISQSSLHKVTTITTTGYGSYTVDAGVNILHVEASAGGGGGGGGFLNSSDLTISASGAGGNSGGYVNCVIVFSSYTGHNTLAYYIGAGGAGGVALYTTPALFKSDGGTGGLTTLQVNGTEIFTLVGGLGGNGALVWTQAYYTGGAARANTDENTIEWTGTTHLLTLVNLKIPRTGASGAISNNISTGYDPGVMEVKYGVPVAERAGPILRPSIGDWAGGTFGAANFANGGNGASGWIGQGGIAGYCNAANLSQLVGSNARGSGSGGAGGSTVNAHNGTAAGTAGSPGVLMITAYKGPLVDAI